MGLIILKTSDQQNSNKHNSFLKQKYNQIFTSITQLFVKTFTLYKKRSFENKSRPLKISCKQPTKLDKLCVPRYLRYFPDMTSITLLFTKPQI